jgi:hypothetical protein
MLYRLALLCRACAQIILLTALIVGGASRALAQNQNIRAQVQPLLGAHENAASVSRAGDCANGVRLRLRWSKAVGSSPYPFSYRGDGHHVSFELPGANR